MMVGVGSRKGGTLLRVDCRHLSSCTLPISLPLNLTYLHQTFSGNIWRLFHSWIDWNSPPWVSTVFYTSFLISYVSTELTIVLGCLTRSHVRFISHLHLNYFRQVSSPPPGADPNPLPSKIRISTVLHEHREV
jgi:hypothetical protein